MTRELTLIEYKDFPTLHVASATTGISLCDGLNYSRMMEITSHILGYSIWTHELAHKPTLATLREIVNANWPLLPSSEEAKEDWEAAAAKAVEAYGKTMTIPKGDGVRDIGPIKALSEIMDGEHVTLGEKP